MPFPPGMTTATLSMDFRQWIGGAGQEATIVIDSPVALVSQLDDIVVPKLVDERYQTSGGLLTVDLPTNNQANWQPNNWAYMIRAYFESGQRMAWLVYLNNSVTLADAGQEIDWPGSGRLYWAVESRFPPFGAPVDLVDGANIAVDASEGNHFRVTLNGNRTLLNPSNAIDGQRLLFELVQGAGGNHTLALDSSYKLGEVPYVLSATAGLRDFMGVIYNASTGLFYVIALVKGY